MQGQDLDARFGQAGEPLADAFDLPRARQEGEEVAGVVCQGLADGGDEGR